MDRDDEVRRQDSDQGFPQGFDLGERVEGGDMSGTYVMKLDYTFHLLLLLGSFELHLFICKYFGDEMLK